MSSLRPYHNAADNPRLQAKVEKLMAEGREKEVIDSLTVRQRLFVEEYLADFDGHAAVVRAGFAKKHAAKYASNLLKHPAIRVAIDAATRERASKAALDVNYVIDKLTRVIENMEAFPKDPKAQNTIIAAADKLARHLGMYIEKVEVTGKDGEAIKYEEVRDEADAFTRAIDSLAARGRKGGSSEEAGA